MIENPSHAVDKCQPIKLIEILCLRLNSIEAMILRFRDMNSSIKQIVLMRWWLVTVRKQDLTLTYQKNIMHGKSRVDEVQTNKAEILKNTTMTLLDPEKLDLNQEQKPELEFDENLALVTSVKSYVNRVQDNEIQKDMEDGTDVFRKDHGEQSTNDNISTGTGQASELCELP